MLNKKLFLSSLCITASLLLGFSNTTLALPKTNSSFLKDKLSTIKNTEAEYKIDYKANRKNVIDAIDDNSILILFSGYPPFKTGYETYAFTPNRNFYYLTGIDEEKLILVITKNNDKINETLFIYKSNPELEKWLGKSITAKECTSISDIKNIKYFEEYENFMNNLLSDKNYKNLYLNINPNDYMNSCEEEKNFSEKISNNYPDIKIKEIYSIINSLRTIKSHAEIENIKKAISITSDGIINTMKNAKPGMMEYELEAHFNFPLTYAGVKDFAFPSIIASGKNGTTLHYDKNDNKTRNNDLVLMDVGAQYNYYCADISRTFPVNGNFTERQKQIYNIVLKAQIETIKSAKPGLTLTDLQNICKEVLAEECTKIELIKNESDLDKYYFHAVSHTLGLDVHDAMKSNGSMLEPGMVITVEPGLYIEEEGIGIRIEDDIVITKDGCEVLSKNIPKTVKEIEKLMEQE